MSGPPHKAKDVLRQYALPLCVGYAGLGAAWILLSDLLLEAVVADPANRSSLQTYKGWAFVAATTLLLYLLLSRLSRLPAPAAVAPADGFNDEPQNWRGLHLRVVGISLLLILALLSNFGFNIWFGRTALVETAAQDTRNLTHVIEEQTAALISGAVLALRATEVALASADRVSAGNAWSEAQLREKLKLLPSLRGMVHVDSSGTVVHDPGSGTRQLAALATREFFQFHRQHPSPDTHIGKPFVGERVGAIFTISRRLSTPSGEFAGVLVAAVSIPYLEQLYSALETQYGRSITLARHDGTILVRIPRVEGVIGRSFISPIFTEHLPRADHGTFRTVSTIDGIARIQSYRSVPNLPLVVTVGLNEADLLADWRRQTQIYGGIVTAVILTIVWLGYLVLRELNHRSALSLSLAESEARFQAFMNASPAIAWIRDQTGRYVYVNRAFRQAFGQEQQGWAGRKEFDVLTPPVTQEMEGGQPEIPGPEAPEEMIVESTRADGRRQYWNMIKFPLPSTAGQAYVGGIAIDIAKQKQAEQSLLQSAQRLRDLGARLIEVEEAERRTINRELHDRLGQGLATLKLTLNLIHASIPAGSRNAVDDRFDNARKLLDASIVQVRDVMADLHPPALDDYGLQAALSTYAESLRKGTDTAIVLSGDDIQPRLPAAMELALFRIAQGALTNTLKHAHAASVELCIVNTAEHVTLTISDDGVGFDPADPDQPSANWGLSIMRERAEAAGMNLRIDSRPGHGTRVTVEALRKST